MHSSAVTLARCGKFRKKLKYTGSGRKKLFYGEKVERNFSGKIAVLIFNNLFLMNIGPVACQHNIAYRYSIRIFVWCIKLQLYSVEIVQKEPL
jgi:hypothetical protein